MNDHDFSCPKCGSADVRRSRKQGLSEIPGMLLGTYPFRCMSCGERFFGNVLKLATRGFVHCPKCLRLDVQPWLKHESRLSGWDQLRLALRAQTYRCYTCRLTFLSFRKQLKPFEKPGEESPITDSREGARSEWESAR